MAITSRLSRKLQETLGTEATDDMVDWMHGVEAQRAELRELNEMMFARFDARLGEVGAELRQELVQVRQDVSVLARDMEARFGQMEGRFGRLEARLERRFADLMKWSFVFWVGSVVTLIGGLAALDRFLP